MSAYFRETEKKGKERKGDKEGNREKRRDGEKDREIETGRDRT